MFGSHCLLERQRAELLTTCAPGQAYMCSLELHLGKRRLLLLVPFLCTSLQRVYL